MVQHVIPNRDFMRENPWIPITAVTLYAILIIYGKHKMKDAQPWNLRKLMALWNLSLSLFSFIGFFRTLPHVIHNLYSYPISNVICDDPESAYGSGMTGLWVQLFVLSKFPELLDTFFIVIHKKPLIFLHWYHHITVLLCCWYSYAASSPVGLFFCFMNYGVHAVMYGYYFLMVMKWKPKWFNSVYITIAQISQMIGGVIITLMGYYFTHQVEGCYVTDNINMAAFLMYGSYLFLFCQFFVKRYLNKGKKKSKKE